MRNISCGLQSLGIADLWDNSLQCTNKHYVITEFKTKTSLLWTVFLILSTLIWKMGPLQSLSGVWRLIRLVSHSFPALSHDLFLFWIHLLLQGFCFPLLPRQTAWLAQTWPRVSSCSTRVAGEQCCGGKRRKDVSHPLISAFCEIVILVSPDQGATRRQKEAEPAFVACSSVSTVSVICSWLLFQLYLIVAEKREPTVCHSRDFCSWLQCRGDCGHLAVS